MSGDLGIAAALPVEETGRSTSVSAGWDARPKASLPMLLRLHLTYLWRHKRLLSLTAPRLFTELVQQRKLVDRDPRMPGLIDKLTVKRFVSDMLGPDWVTPTLWSGDILPTTPPCSYPFVVKSRHGCKQLRVVCSQADDWAMVRRAAASWMRRSYGDWLDEWGYRDVPRGVLIEPFVGVAPVLPIDYKLYVFHGRVAVIQVHSDRATNHRWTVFDRRWRRLSGDGLGEDMPPPMALDRMIEGAEALASGFDFVRIDFYDVGRVPRFGEMTFYPGSGLDPFDPFSLDVSLGQCWLTGAPFTGAPVASGPASRPVYEAPSMPFGIS
ncbi:ATP-grasp fold amidoligase family protein [Sphingomonas sp. PAMC 26621]|uniref:ATP-grasp fold amidoligase family protein n=1 Tax=Sphingomonas sp. PAMC 26621 TaxID=1112213 RepID=UPI0002893735|nr:ATP-grasp fold amidoligase family protein [Sphingomonas sp. PAMC 26621]